VTYERTSARRSHSPVEASILDGPFFSRIVVVVVNGDVDGDDVEE
jgi:hypothetical protein